MKDELKAFLDEYVNTPARKASLSALGCLFVTDDYNVFTSLKAANAHGTKTGHRVHVYDIPRTEKKPAAKRAKKSKK